MSFFNTALAVSGAVQNTLYGEAFLVEPRAKADPNGRATADASRPSMTIVGVWSEPNATATPTNRTGHPAGEGAKFDDSKPMFDFETSALPYEILIGDLVTRVADGKRYAVAVPNDDGFTRTTATLTAARGRQS